MPQTLGQVIAMESAARAEANRRLGALHKDAQRKSLFSGFDKTYEPFSETDEEAQTLVKRLPPEGSAVQLRADELVESFMAEMGTAVDLARAKDDANCAACADVTVGGQVLLREVPATHLLHMEKVLADLCTFIAALPVEDPTERWQPGEDGVKRARDTFTVRNSVKKTPLLLHPGNERHAPQVAVIEDNVPEGRWTTVRYTAALSPSRKRELERRAATLRTAFKVAREAANQMEVIAGEAPSESSVITAYLLG